MSLVICANQYEGTSERTSNNNQAYSFKNNLGTQMKIPPNSEVAVQSVKINKDGTVTVKPTDIFYVYQGALVKSDAAVFTDIDKTTAYPVQVQLNETGVVEELSIDELNSRLQIALNRGIINLAFNGLQTSAVKRNGTTGVFEGFELKFTQQNASDTTNNIPTAHSPYFDGFASNYTFSGGVFESVGTITPVAKRNKRVAILTSSPLGNVGGKFRVDFSASFSLGTGWAVGLRRSRNNNSGKEPGFNRPKYWANYGNNLHSEVFYDYVVMSIQDKKTSGSPRYLRVFQACIRAGTDFGDNAMSRAAPYTMREVVYYGSHNSNFSDVYNMSTNFANQSYTFVEFEMLGDQLNLTIGNDGSPGAKAAAGLSHALVNPDVLTASAKENVFKPVALTTELLYPQLWLEQASKKLTVTTFHGKTGYTFGDPKRDWWARMENQGLTHRFCKRVDTRYWADLSDSGIYPYAKPTAGAYGVEDKRPVGIVTEDPVNYVNTIDANCEQLLGFDGFSVLSEGTYVQPTYTIQSNSAPEITSRGSAFIRLNNFTQQSFNAGKGALSKILYHIPRFDNSGNQTGSDLFFEPTEKTYVALNNPNELNINSFDLDIVTEEETFATDLVGKSIICLHFRDKK